MWLMLLAKLTFMLRLVKCWMLLVQLTKLYKALPPLFFPTWGELYPFLGGKVGRLAVDYFTCSQSIAMHLRSVFAVISHTGFGCLFETRKLGRPLLVDVM